MPTEIALTRRGGRPVPFGGLSAPAVWLGVIILLYLVIGVQYAALTPRWQVPDEPAHYNYIKYLVENGSLPTLDPGEYQQGYLAQLTSQKFPPNLSVNSLQYESWQPPLYYLLEVPIYLATGGALLPLRLFSLLLGAGVIVFTYLAVNEALGSPLLAVTAAGFVAFIPQHVAMMAGIDNDSLAELLIAVGLWWTLRTYRVGLTTRNLLILAALVAAVFLTKSQAYVLAPVAGIMILFKWRDEGWAGWKPFIQRAVLVFIPALLIGALFWGRNLAIYRWPDFMAAIRHDQVVADQPRTRDWIAQFGSAEVVRRFLKTTFQSFWGQFGWMGVVMPDRYYWALLGLTGFLLLGFLIAFIGAFTRSPQSTHNQSTNPQLLFTNYLLLLLSFLTTLGLYLYYNLTYVQHQGRYLFPALVPIAAAVAVSLWAWAALADRLVKRNIGWLIPLIVVAALAALDVFALYRFIIPALT
jgi:4-amino-4-deoxy-L-arabinose transferase-like glycosyltransferase